jgi:NMD protein affecting ribosome stability and mRNA decay
MHHYSPNTAKSTPKSVRASISEIDPYLSKSNPKDFSICRQCHAIYHNKRWTLDTKSTRTLAKVRPAEQGRTVYTFCPACQKIQDRFPGGILSLKGSFMKEHREEILHRVKNEELKARHFNPLARIIDIHEENGAIEITTTNEKLAQRIGKSLHKAYKGDLIYKWSQSNKFTRVEWMRE